MNNKVVEKRASWWSEFSLKQKSNLTPTTVEEEKINNRVEASCTHSGSGEPPGTSCIPTKVLERKFRYLKHIFPIFHIMAPFKFNQNRQISS